MPIDITAAQRKTVLALLSRYLPNTTAWVYGSRVKWAARPESDLDMVAFATPEQAGRVSALREAFEESNLPFRVDLFIWDEVPELFRKQIEAEHVVLVEKKDSGLPSEWKKHEVKALIDDGALEIGDGYRAKNTELVGSGVPFARAGNIKNGFQFNGADQFPEACLNRLGDKISKPGDVVFTSKGTVGRFAFVKEDTPQFVYSPQLCFWRSRDHGLIDPRFLFFWMSSHEFFVQFKGVAGQTDMAEYVSLRDQRNMHLTLPLLPEQRAIAHILGTLDDKIELNRQMNQTLEEMARALFKSWFVDFDPVRAKATLKQRDATPSQGGSDWSVERARAYLDRMDPNIAALFPDRFVDSELGPMPAGWEVRTLGDLCNKPEYGYTASARNEPTGVKFLRITDINKKAWIEWESVPYCDISSKDFDKYRLHDGDILIARMADPGHGCMMEEGQQAVFASYLIRFRPVRKLYARLLQFWLRSDAYWELVKGRGGGTTRVSLNAKVLSDFSLFVPTCNLVDAFGQQADTLRARVVANSIESRTLTALRDTLLPKLMSREVRINDITPLGAVTQLVR